MSYPKLRGAIREKFGTQAAFAKALKMHPVTLSNKLAGRVDWTMTEVEAAAKLLDIPQAEAFNYFFTR